MNTDYSPKSGRYEEMIYRRCGRSGLNLPVISLGLWHNFGDLTPHAIKREMCFAAFDKYMKSIKDHRNYDKLNENSFPKMDKFNGQSTPN